MRTIEIKAYLFNDLSKEAQKNAIKNNQPSECFNPFLKAIALNRLKMLDLNKLNIQLYNEALTNIK